MYKFVTREDLKKLDFVIGEDIDLVYKLLNECYAIRETGLVHFKWRFEHDPELQNEWNGETTTEEDFDAEAAKLLEKSCADKTPLKEALAKFRGTI
jgi:hypothetical protein